MDSVTHFEVPANNIERAKNFYSDVFGWDFYDAGIAGMEYLVAQTTTVDENKMPRDPGAINGGIYKKETSRDQQMIVISAASIDDKLQKIEKTGGRIIVPKKKVGNEGYYARFMDTEGNLVGLWQNAKK